MSNIKQAKEIVSKELSLPASKLVGGAVANNSGTLEGTDLQLMYSEGYENGTAKNTSEVLAGTTTIAPTWVDGTNYVKKVKDGSWVTVENEPVFGTIPDFFTGRDAYKGGKWYGESTSVGSTVDSHDPFSDGSTLARYTFDSTTNSINSNYNLTTYGSVPYVSGKFGDAVSFNGSTSNYISGGAIPDFKLSSITISAWVYMTTHADADGNTVVSNHIMAGGSGSSANGGCTLDIDTNTISGRAVFVYYFLNDESTTDSNGFTNTKYNASATTANAVPLNQWVHLCGVLDGGNSAKIYMNGVLEGTVSSSQSIRYGTVDDNFGIGATVYDSARYNPFNGLIDQVSIIGKACTHTEVTTLYNEELPLFTELPPQTYLPYTVEATGGSVTAVNEWKYPDLVTETSYSSELRTDKLMMNGMEAFACRAWVNFNGTGTVAIRASGNVSSITDNGTGSYTINFATAMPDTNYSMVATSRGVALDVSDITPRTTSSYRVITTNTSFNNTDYEYINVQVLR